MFEINFHLSKEQAALRSLARKIAREKIRPVAAKYDESGEFPWDIIKILNQAGFFGVFIPEQYGGIQTQGVGIVDLCLITEELSKACGGIAICHAGSALGTFPLLLYGSDAQKEKYLPDIAQGKKLAAFALTEANAGSDVSGVQTTAVKDGNYYVINGTKQWITNGGEAEVYSVIVVTDKTRGARGLSAFILEKGMPGFSFGKKENKMGIRASTTRELVFQDCRVHKSQLLGREGRGFLVAMKTFEVSRPGVAAQALGIAEGALELAVAYARARKQFGRPIASFQGLQFMLADMATQVAAAKTLVYASARAVDEAHPNMGAISAMAKLFASDTAMRVTTDSVQVYGGYGYMKEYPVEKMMRDAKITQIYEGTNQIQREIIALELIKESARQQ